MNLDNNYVMFSYIGQSSVKDEGSIAAVKQTTQWMTQKWKSTELMSPVLYEDG